MKRIAIAAGLVLLPLMAGGCSRDPVSLEEFTPVAREVLAFAEQDARQSQPGRVSDGPLYVNVNSFRTAANKITGAKITDDSMAVLLGDPIQAQMEQALLCDTTSQFSGCWVRKYGVWVNLNLVRRSGNEMAAHLRTTSTNRAQRPSDFCHRVWRLTFTRAAEGAPWRMTDRELRRDCGEPAA